MRVLLLIVALSVCGYAWSENSNDHKTVTQKNQSANQEKNNTGFNTSSLEKTIRESIKEAAEKSDHYTNEKLESERKLVEYTGELSFFTKWLAFATFIIAGIAIWQGIQLRRTVDIAIKESQPVLFPYVFDMINLHPLVQSNISINHSTKILVNFDNYGKTPGNIREIRADLFLTFKDELPFIDVNKLPFHEHFVMVPGGARGNSPQTGVLDFKKIIIFSPTELDELLAEAKSGKFRRFYFAGHIIYDDFFGMRHESHFCIKLRLYLDSSKNAKMFQVAKGGSIYNRITSKKIPKNDPLANA